MEKLREFLSRMTVREQTEFAWACGSTIGYWRRCLCIERYLSLEICSEIERNSHGVLLIEELRPDLKLAHLRKNRFKKAA